MYAETSVGRKSFALSFGVQELTHFTSLWVNEFNWTCLRGIITCDSEI